MTKQTRTSRKELIELNELAKTLNIPVRIFPAAYGASVKVEGVETYHRTNTGAYMAAFDAMLPYLSKGGE